MTRRSFDESDLIRLKLQQLDAQLDRRPLFERLMTEAPALPFAAAFILGIIFANFMHGSNLRGWVWTVCGIAVIAFFVSLKTFPRLRLPLLFGCACTLMAAFGFVRYSLVLQVPPDHISHYLRTERDLATLRGVVVSPVRTDDQAHSTIPWISAKSSFYLNTTAVKGPDGWHRTCGKVRVQVSEPIHHVQPGNTVQLYCHLSRFSPPANPGEFDLQTFMAQRGVIIAAGVPARESIEVINTSSSWTARLRSVLYHYASDALLDETVTDPDVQALASALLLGRRNALDPQITAAFRDTNLAHYISLSGMHVGILAGSLWFLLRTAGLGKQPRAALCIVLLLIYAMIVPPRAPTMRAVFLSCFFFGSALVQRRPTPLNTLAISAGVLLLIHPFELFTAGWQLSFLSVLGILLFYSGVRYHLLSRVFYPLRPYLTSRLDFVTSLLYAAIELLAVGVSAWLVIAPILLYYFGRVNPLSPLWTILVFPFVITILYAGFLKILLSAILPTVAALLGVVLNAAVTAFENSVKFLATVDVLQITSHRPALLLILTIYGLMVAIYLLSPIYYRTKQVLWILLIGSFLFPAVSRHLDINNRNTLDMTCLSVGHGQAVVLSGPGNEHLLFDAGSITHKNIANKIILPFLQYRRIFHLDGAYLSHGDLDHINALGDLAAAIHIDRICANRVLLESARKPSVERELYESLAAMNIPMKPVEEYHNGPEAMRIQSLWPGAGCETDAHLSENNQSEVMLIEYADRKILLCGDIERQGQRYLMELYPNLTVDVLVLPHHGSTTNLNPDFVDHFSPSIVIASCTGRRVKNAYHPADPSITRAFYTPTSGAVQIKIKADGALSAAGYLSQ